MRRLLLALVLIPLTAPVYAERNCTDHFVEGAFHTWDDCTGTYTWASGDVYEGDFKDGDFHGKSTYTWASGDVYEGDWKDGKRTGKGKFSWASGSVYEGDWKDDVRHGEGKLTRPDGTLINEGIWNDGEYSKSLTNTKKGMDFRDGNGVLQNYESAKEFFVLAAQGGEQQAMLHLANMYKDQKAIDEPTMSDTIAGWFADDESERYLIKAHMWANLAGSKLTQTIEKQLNPEEIKQAQDLAKECLENDYQGC